jgi:predicted nucleic acid-binding protein
VNGFLLDTNVISEIAKPQPSQAVLAWLAAADESSVFLSAATLAELRYGVERLPHGKRRKRLSEWLFTDLHMRFDRRIIAIDEAIAHAWGQVVYEADAAGRPIGVMDGFIAATARVYELTLVTRNETDFGRFAKSMLNPWST